MKHVSFLLIAVVAVSSARSDDRHDKPNDLVSVQKILDSGAYAEGETSLLLALDREPDNDEIRFGLGVLQFLRAVETLGHSLYEYGAVSKNTREPFLRLPVPENDDPVSISYDELGRVLGQFSNDLQRAEATLAAIEDERVKLKLKLAQIKFDFTRSGENLTSLTDIVGAFNARLPEKNPELLFHFDRGDVAWLRAYCHLLCGLVEAQRAIDLSDGFHSRMGRVFPEIESKSKDTDSDWYKFLRVTDSPRLRRMRLHFAEVGRLNHETWKFIRSETDDDFEWLPHPRQTDQLNLPMSDAQIDAWLNVMTQLEELMTGERLMPSYLLKFVAQDSPAGKGLNFQKLLDDPPTDLFNWKRIRENGIDEKYLEDEAGRPVFDFGAVFRIANLFNGPFGFARAVRMN